MAQYTLLLRPTHPEKMQVVGRGPYLLALTAEGAQVRAWHERMKAVDDGSGGGVIDAPEVPTELFVPELTEEVRTKATAHANAAHFSRRLPVEIADDAVAADRDYRVERSEITGYDTRWFRPQSSGRTVVYGPNRLQLERLLVQELDGDEVARLFSEAADLLARHADPDRPDPDVPTSGFPARRVWLLLDGALFGVGPQIGEGSPRTALLGCLSEDDLARLQEVGQAHDPFLWSDGGGHTSRFDPVPALSELLDLARTERRG